MFSRIAHRGKQNYLRRTALAQAKTFADLRSTPEQLRRGFSDVDVEAAMTEFLKTASRLDGEYDFGMRNLSRLGPNPTAYIDLRQFASLIAEHKKFPTLEETLTATKRLSPHYDQLYSLLSGVQEERKQGKQASHDDNYTERSYGGEGGDTGYRTSGSGSSDGTMVSFSGEFDDPETETLVEDPRRGY
jgi:hypothetical protein